MYQAHAVRDLHDPDSCPDYDPPRWPQKRQIDRQGLRSRYPPDRVLLQLELDLRQQSLPLPERRLHPNAEGKLKLDRKRMRIY